MCYGTARGGLDSVNICWLPISKVAAFKALAPINVFYRAAPSVEVQHFLGTQRDVTVCNLGLVAPGDSIQVGEDEWLVFPWTRKQHNQVETEESWRAGWAYRKVT